MRTVCSTQNWLITGSMPGMAESMKETLELGSAPNWVEADENNLAFDLTWAWISMPITISQSDFAPEMILTGGGGGRWGMVFLGVVGVIKRGLWIIRRGLSTMNCEL